MKQIIITSLLFSVLLTSAFAEWNRFMEDPNLFEGDMELNENQTRLLSSPFQFGLSHGLKFIYHWDKGVAIPYSFAEDLEKHERYKGKIEKALKDYEAQTCLRFKKRTTEKKHFIHFEYGNGCASMVGRQGSGNFIRLAPGCMDHGTIIHEIMHTLGVFHEHSRGDRDQYIKINPENMRCCASQFRIKDLIIDSLGFPYDLDSVMHYGPYAFSKAGTGPTIEAVDPAKKYAFGRKGKFSEGDIAQLNAMYCDGPKGPDAGSTSTSVPTKAPLTTKSTTAPTTRPSSAPTTRPSTAPETNRPTTFSKPPSTNMPSAQPTSSQGGKSFQQRTSSKCLGLNEKSELVFNSECKSRFEISSGGVFSLSSAGGIHVCAKPLSRRSDSQISFSENCGEQFVKIQQGEFFIIQHVGTGKCIHPKRGSSNPQDGTAAVIYHECKGLRIQFKEI